MGLMGKKAFARKREVAIEWSLFACAIAAVGVMFAIVFTLTHEAIYFFQHVHVFDFLFGTKWAPLFEPRSYGVLPLIVGTLQIAAISTMVSVPLGLLVAIYLSELAPHKVRSFVKPAVELLAGIPSVVFGFLALTALTPTLKSYGFQLEVFNALSAGLVVGVMTLPMVASLSDDALRAVPSSVKSAAYAVGATRIEVLFAVSFPAAASGIASACILAFARAVGETMAVTMAAGANPSIVPNPMLPTQTMTAYIAQVSMGDTPHGSIEYQSIFAVGLLLLIMTLLINRLASFAVRYLQRYSV